MPQNYVYFEEGGEHGMTSTNKHNVILHCDMNAFYASVEIMLNPELKGLAVAVGGSKETRHGIILAKSELAKRAGVKTGMAIWEAQKLCPNLIIVPPQYDQYVKYSQLAREIYEEYTDYVEPYGMDECFLDITGVYKIHGGAIALAEEIRQRMKDELGLTISVGLSYNKVLAKMGSDMKKPDALTVLRPSDVKRRIWPLPIKDLFFCGRATAEKLAKYSVRTIGDLAQLDREFLIKKFGKHGATLHDYANGIDHERVCHKFNKAPVKSIGHGVTCVSDLYTVDEIWKVMLTLAHDIGAKMRVQKLKAKGVQICIKHSDFTEVQRQMRLPEASRVPNELAKHGISLVENLVKINKDAILPARSVTIRAIDLIREDGPMMMSLFEDKKSEKKEKLFDTIDDLRKKFGKNIVKEAVLLEDTKIAPDNDEKRTSFDRL